MTKQRLINILNQMAKNSQEAADQFKESKNPEDIYRNGLNQGFSNAYQVVASNLELMEVTEK